mgnify:CR=1 FL=1
MVQNRIVQFIIDNWKDIGIFFTGIWAVFIAAKKAYLSGFVPLKAWIKKMDDAATQLEYNGGSSTKDMVREIKIGQEKLLKKVDIVNNRQTAMIELNDLALFENDNTGKCIRANAALCNLFGATQNKMLGYGWLSYIKNPDHERELFEQAIETDNEITRHYTIMYKGEPDNEIPATYVAHIKRDENGAVINVTGKVFIR